MQSRTSARQTPIRRSRFGRAWSLGWCGGLLAVAVISAGRGADIAGAIANDPASEGPWQPSLSIWFFSGRAELDATEVLKIAALAAQARVNPDLEFGIRRAVPVRASDAVAGSVPGPARLQLEPQRLEAVRNAMLEAGIPAVRIYTGAFGGRMYDVDRRTVIFLRSRRPASDVPEIGSGQADAAE